MSTTNPYFDAPSLRPVITETGVYYFEVEKNWPVYLGDGKWLIVPKGSRSNFASVPWLLRIIISSSDPVISIPAIVHDYLVSEWQEIVPMCYTRDGDNFVLQGPLYPGDGYDWVQSAKTFRKLALSFRGRVPHFKARLAYVALRLFAILRKQPHE